MFLMTVSWMSMTLISDRIANRSSSANGRCSSKGIRPLICMRPRAVCDCRVLLFPGSAVASHIRSSTSGTTPSFCSLDIKTASDERVMLSSRPAGPLCRFGTVMGRCATQPIRCRCGLPNFLGGADHDSLLATRQDTSARESGEAGSGLSAPSGHCHGTRNYLGKHKSSISSSGRPPTWQSDPKSRCPRSSNYERREASHPVRAQSNHP